MGQQRKATNTADELPLYTEHHVERDPVTGLDVPVTRYRRGILAREAREYTADNLMAMVPVEPRDTLNRLCEQLRDFLEKQGLPSDRVRLWIHERGGEWRPLDEKADLEIKIGQRKALWIKRVEELTEPLSRGRNAADLLWSLNNLLERPGIDEHLWHVAHVMSDYLSYCLSGAIGNLAVSGATMQKARKSGPAARKERAGEIRKVVWRHAQAYWNRNPAFRNVAIKTAECIAESVTSELRILGLLRRDRLLRPKTIADHIRASSKG